MHKLKDLLLIICRAEKKRASILTFIKGFSFICGADTIKKLQSLSCSLTALQCFFRFPLDSLSNLIVCPHFWQLAIPLCSCFLSPYFWLSFELSSLWNLKKSWRPCRDLLSSSWASRTLPAPCTVSSASEKSTSDVISTVLLVVVAMLATLSRLILLVDIDEALDRLLISSPDSLKYSFKAQKSGEKIKT